MRPIFLLVNQMTGELGVERVARELGVSEAHVYKFGEDPERSGKSITVRHLLRLIALVSSETQNRQLQTLLDEMLKHVSAAAGRVIVHPRALEELGYAMEQLRGVANIAVHEPHCPQCDAPLTLTGIFDDHPLYICKGCHGMGSKGKR